jgi:DNA polymerase III epsilon subunit-like protein
MTDIVFLDTETTGLSPDDEIWEFAAIRRFDSGIESELHMFIAHDESKAQFLPTSFFRDYRERFPGASYNDYELPQVAATRIQDFTLGAHIVGAVPSFDTERLAKLLRAYRLEPKWHYHLLDVENLVVGYLAGRGELMAPPWKSDELSRTIGVEPGDFARHTAMGDAQWVRAQYDVVVGAA